MQNCGTESLSGAIKAFNGTTEIFSKIGCRPRPSGLSEDLFLSNVKSTPLRVAVSPLTPKVRQLSYKYTPLNNKISTANLRLSLAIHLCVLCNLSRSRTRSKSNYIPAFDLDFLAWTDHFINSLTPDYGALESDLIILKNATADLHIKISPTNEANVKVVAV